MPYYSTAGTACNTFTNCWVTSSSATTAATTCSGNYVVWRSTSGTATTSAYDYQSQQAQQEYVWHRRYNDYGAEQRRQRDVVNSHSKQARERAQELLVENLSPEQQKTFKKNKWFVVEGGKSKQRYRINSTDHLVANIDVLEGDDVKHRLCAHCDLSAVPLGDQLLAQKIMLEASEDEFLRVANRHAA